ncbi:hypothetical protein [Albibacterium indicum]|uniref:hypothetical protein n=1 Tax=Albibacterium indicum TaxID=2292082 RepID=UPI000E4CA4F1|nr:hypothetical protein [Pedobacter indicus]
MRQIYIFLKTILLIVFISCSKNDIGTPVNFEVVNDAFCTTITPNQGMEEKTFVITSQSEYELATGCKDRSPIANFDTHFLLGGWRAFNTCAHLTNQSLTVKGRKLQYQIDVDIQDCQKLDTVYFMISVPLSYINHEIDFRITY